MVIIDIWTSYWPETERIPIFGYVRFVIFLLVLIWKVLYLNLHLIFEKYIFRKNKRSVHLLITLLENKLDSTHGLSSRGNKKKNAVAGVPAPWWCLLLLTNSFSWLRKGWSPYCGIPGSFLGVLWIKSREPDPANITSRIIR